MYLMGCLHVGLATDMDTQISMNNQYVPTVTATARSSEMSLDLAVQ